MSTGPTDHVIDYFLALAQSEPRVPFSNGSEWDAWSAHNCQRCIYEEDCPLVLVAMTGHTPGQWREIDPLSLRYRYECDEFVVSP